MIFFSRCDANTLATNFVTSPPWPYRFLALTRTDTVLRPSLENCVLQVFPPGRGLFSVVMQNNSSCNKSNLLDFFCNSINMHLYLLKVPFCLLCLKDFIDSKMPTDY